MSSVNLLAALLAMFAAGALWSRGSSWWLALVAYAAANLAAASVER